MSSGTMTTTSFTNALKVIYPQKRVNLLFYKKHALMAMIKKVDDFYGVDDAMKITVQHGVPSGGRSAAFADAQAYRSTGDEARFSITRRSDYQIARLENEVIEASSRDIGALISILKNKMDGAMKNLSRNAAMVLWGNGGGARGAVGTIGNGDGTNDKITLANVDDIVFFEKDMVLYSDEDDGTGSTTDRSDVFQVYKVDRSAGEIYCVSQGTTTPVNITTLTNPVGAGDYLFQSGDFGAVMDGIPAYIPWRASGTLPGTFNGVNRDLDADRLAGVSFDASQYPLEEGCKLLNSRIVRNGGSPEYGFMHPFDLTDMELSLGTRVQYNDVTPAQHANIPFTGVKMGSASGGIVTYFSDLNVERGYQWQLDLACWKLHTLGKFPHQQRVNGGKTMTRHDADEEEFRQVYRGNTSCDAPGWNGVAKLPSAA